ncbi:MAG: TetR family transcriptional regulator [Puniceicoccaceae bacterium 5H]|nr:MAG: TetR family transcriptional regulator [Puniceicoccaceae bacterium 5H]
MGRTSDARERLEKAIYQLMWDKSYNALTIDMICKEADVKKGSFYYYFESKTDLAVAAMEKAWQELKTKLDPIFSPAKDPLERLFDHADYSYEKTREIQRDSGQVLGCPCFNIASEVCCVESELAEKTFEILNRYRRYFTSAVKEAAEEGVIDEANPEEAARILYSVFDGMMTQARVRNDPEVLLDLKPAYRRLLKIK